MSRVVFRGLTLACGLACVLCTSASADNIVPPPWVGSDPAFETFQEWEFHTPGIIAPDGDIPTINPGIPTATPGPGVKHTLAGGGFGLDGYDGISEPGNTITFSVPNIPDNRPVKHLRIQINGVWTTAPPPTVAFLAGSGFSGPSASVFVGSDETIPGFHRWEDWDMFPNPDFEQLVLTVPQGSFVNQVVIHTISIPEPSSALLLACPAVCLVRRRRRFSH